MQFDYKTFSGFSAGNSNNSGKTSPKIGFFKLAAGGEALVRINCTDGHELKFANVHAPIFGHKYEGLGSGYTPVSCLNHPNSFEDNCPFCKAAAAGHPVVGKVSKKVYVEMLVAYKDSSTGGWSAAVPVIWERPSSFARDLEEKIKNYGSLKDVILKISRTGSGKDDTRYNIDYIPVFNDAKVASNTIPADFSAFDNFNIAKHSFWEKSAADLTYYLDHGTFPQEENDGDGNNSKSVDAAYGAAKAATQAPDATPYVASVEAAPIASSVVAPAPVAAAKSASPFDNVDLDF